MAEARTEVSLTGRWRRSSAAKSTGTRRTPKGRGRSRTPRTTVAAVSGGRRMPSAVKWPSARVRRHLRSPGRPGTRGWPWRRRRDGALTRRGWRAMPEGSGGTLPAMTAASSSGRSLTTRRRERLKRDALSSGQGGRMGKPLAAPARRRAESGACPGRAAGRTVDRSVVVFLM